MPLEDRQAAFAGALLDPRLPVPQGVVDPAGNPAPKRFAVYRNNVTVSLIEAKNPAAPAPFSQSNQLFRNLGRSLHVPVLGEAPMDYGLFNASLGDALRRRLR